VEIAAGAKLPFTQAEVQLRGAAMECRIYAEDPANNFFPSPGKIVQLAEPSGPGVRVDSGVYPGWTVPIDYDPMLAKLIVWHDTREHTIERMLRALSEYHIGGIESNLALFRTILNDAAFRAGDLDTGYLDRLLKQPPAEQEPPPELVAIAAQAVLRAAQAQAESPAEAAPSRWLNAGRADLLR
jgi:acetyl-CoA carboxylase biotin carboxylase subunit